MPARFHALAANQKFFQRMDPEEQRDGDNTELVSILYTHRARLLKRIDSRIGLNPYADFSAEDVLQEAFTDACRGFESLRSREPAVVAAWLNRIVDNRLAQTMRDRGRAKRGGRSWQVVRSESSIRQLVSDLEDEANETGSQRMLREEMKAAIQEAIRQLPELQRDLVEQYYLDQRSLDDIAVQKGMTKSAVRSLLYRAKAAIKQLLGNSSRWYTEKQ